MDVLFSFPPYPPRATPLSDEEYDDGMRQLLDTLQDFDTLIAQSIGGDGSLDVLNPVNNTAAYAFALMAYVKANTLSMPDLFKRMLSFLDVFDPRQIRYVGEQYTGIIQATAYLAERLDSLQVGAVAISNAILRLDPDASTFTTHHLSAIRLAVLSSRPESILHLINKPIYYFPAASHQTHANSKRDVPLSAMNQHPSTFITCASGLTAKPRYSDVMEYFYLVADAYIQLRDWERALDALETVILYPCRDHVPSKIMVDAYKRFALVYCFSNGSSAKFNIRFSTISPQMAKTFHAVARPYEALVNTFDTLMNDAEPIQPLMTEVDAGSQVWAADNNYGLVRLLVDSFYEYKIKNLARIYHKISIYDIAPATRMQGGTRPWSAGGTEEMVLRMIEQGQISARIEGPPKDEIICFHSDDKLLSDDTFGILVHTTTAHLAKLTAEVKHTDNKISCNPNYVFHMARYKTKYQGTIRADVDDIFTGEEDLMSDD